MDSDTNDLSILSAIFYSLEDAVISKKLDGTITSWNRAAERIFGYSAREVLGKNISIIIPQYLLSEEADIISRIKKGEKIEHYETIRKRKDETSFFSDIIISPLKDQDGIIIGASEIARDITERKVMEEKQALLASIIDSSDDAIISKNLDGIITSWNRGAENIFGYRPHEVIGKHISIIIPLSKLHEESMIIQKIRNGERISHFETIRRTKQGNSINISLTVSPVKDSSGKIIGASKIARDITEKIELEQQKNLYTQRLHELNNYKDEFMAMASHELKTPLTVLKANLQVLDVMVIEDKQKSFLNKALIQLDKIANLMTDLLDVSKMQSGVLELNITEFNLVELFSDVINNVQLTSKEHKIVFKKSHKCLLLKADKERIEQVIINILTNAIKYSPEAKRVQVAILANEKEVIAEVTDSGIGIPNEDIENIFTRFFRVRGVASTFSGSGIGLYISNEIIKRHGGKMWVKSSFGQGSTFYFSLPHSYPEGLNYASKGRYPMKRTL